LDENCQPSSYPRVRRIDIGFEFGQVGVGFKEVGFKMLALSSTCPYWLLSRSRLWGKDDSQIVSVDSSGSKWVLGDGCRMAPGRVCLGNGEDRIPLL